MSNINVYIIIDKENKPVYKTIDLVDLAKVIISLNNKRIHINHTRDYNSQEHFEYKLIIESCEIQDLIIKGGIKNEN